jgi:hypothetical protein
LHRLRELLLLLVQARVVDCERRLLRDRAGGRQRLGADRARRVEAEDRQLRQELAGGCDREERGRRALVEERDQQRMRAAESPRRRDIEHERLVRARRPRLRPLEDRPHGIVHPRLGDVHRPRDELVAALVRDSDHGGVDAEHVDDRRRHRRECLLERETLRERARDLVERVHLA